MSLADSVSTAPSRSRRWGPRASGSVARPGTANTVRPHSSAWLAVIIEPLFSSPSTIRLPALSAAIRRLRIGKLWAAGGVPSGYSLMTVSRRESSRFSAGYIWSRPLPRMPTLTPPASTAARWAAVSMPRAKPETTTTPARARSVLMRAAKLSA